METQIRKVGNSLGSIIPSSMARELKLKEGCLISLTSDGNKITIEPIRRDRFLTMEELLNGDIYTAEDDLIAKPLDSEWIDG